MTVTCPEPEEPPAHSLSRARGEQDSFQELAGLLASTPSAVDPASMERADDAARPRRPVRQWQLRVVPASQATGLAREVRSQREMGAALRLLREEAGLTIDQLAARVAPLNIPGLRRSTIGRLCAGGSLCATREALVALVEACGVVGADVEVWVAAWGGARAGQRPRGRRSAAAAAQPSGESTGSAVAANSPTSAPDSARNDGLEDHSDDDVLGELHVRFTRRSLRMAMLRERFIEASREVNSHLLDGGSSQDALDLIACRALELSKADCAVILLSEGSPQEGAVVRAAAGDGAAEMVGLTVPVSEPPASDMFDIQGAEMIRDLSTLVPLGWQGPGAEFGPAVAMPLRAGNVVSGVLLVLRIKGGARFVHEHVPLLASFADQAAFALELAEKHRQHRELAVLADRDRIAGDLHDHVIQRLFATGMSLQGTVRRITDPGVRRRVSRAVEQLDETVREIRTSIHASGTLGEDSLRRRMLDIVEELSGGPDVITPSVRISGAVDTLVSEELATHATSVLREAVSNAVRHAHAGEVVVTVEATTDLIIDVIDDGVGMPSGVARSGLLGVERRAATCGGLAVVVPGPHGGTRLTWRVPLPAA